MDKSVSGLMTAIKPYLKNWVWLLIGGIIGLIISIIYLRYAEQIYSQVKCFNIR